ncbi:hypothetical protein NDU88_002435 [Pleurodeles waltl]|uniref:MARVEL domain-containing protein n=1 Tax=Pleurodeles waltl TaxID=8319 RepID=A0AAV7KU65_PLEWA|nr:hypothetical protein NDU88_002435 [Pleurodeles waltl]
MAANFEFFKTPEGILKILRFVLIATSLTIFILATANGIYIVVTAIELGVVVFFIVLYVTTLDEIISFFVWPRVDFFNCVVSGVFVGVVSIVAIKSLFNDLIISAGVSRI